LTAQGIQEPFIQDTIWLCVGHIDEVHTFLPDPDAPRGFRLLLGSVTLGYEFLEGLGDSTSLPKYASDYHYSTVGDLLDDTALRTWNESLQTTYLDDIEQVFRDELAITDDEIVYIPSVFEENRWCPNNTALALIPGIVNSLIATGDDETPTKVFLPDPFIRSSNASQDDDPLIQYVNDVLPASSEMYWVDNWDVYHLGMGEVHCGTNTQRTPDGTGDWINDARHLIEE
jgi:protein-arginine deiminase